ncbi:TRAP transporter small permease [Alloalcanivorax sp. C16-2]|uniref:TRAP transporter small permease n=1 Tax=Alloalcanivorax TaxID=3020832 RepID=UPI001933D2C0|nr:TRAP transporter small permease [Alloalcanivorax marinus]MBL7250454.1 TRAP transporter small permease [Alloalcanivorax marinus]
MKFAFKGLLAVLAVLDRTIGVLERLVIGATVLVMALLMSAHVVGQLIFDKGIPGTYEVTEMLIVVMTFVGVSYAARHARHIRMSALYEQLHGAPRKGLLMLICAGTAALMFYFAWKSGQYVVDIHDRGRVSSSLGMPMWIVYLALPAGFGLAGIQYLLTLARNALTPGIWRSFNERETYSDVPVHGVEAGGEYDDRA